MQIFGWLDGSSTWDGMSGRPSGPPQWPRGRGYCETRADLVGYANIFRAELRYLGQPKPEKKEPAPKPPTRRRRK
jgi:hypothetical protein